MEPLKVKATYVRLTTLVQPLHLHQRIDGALFILDCDLFDVAVGGFVLMGSSFRSLCVPVLSALRLCQCSSENAVDA